MNWVLTSDKLPDKTGKYVVLSKQNVLSVKEYIKDNNVFETASVYAWADIERVDVPMIKNANGEHSKYWHIHKRKVERCLSLLQEYETEHKTQKELGEKYNRHQTAIADDIRHGRSYRQHMKCGKCIHGRLVKRYSDTPYPAYRCEIIERKFDLPWSARGEVETEQKAHNIRTMKCDYYEEKAVENNA